MDKRTREMDQEEQGSISHACTVCTVADTYTCISQNHFLATSCERVSLDGEAGWRSALFASEVHADRSLSSATIHQS